MKEKTIGVVLGICIVIFGVGLIISAAYFAMPSKQEMQEQRQKEYDSLRQEGYKAQKAGVPANANPHQKYPNDAKAWLEGWMEANTEKK